MMPLGSGVRGARVALLVTILIWASAFVALRVAIRTYTPVELASLRFVAAAVLLAAFAAVTRMRLPRSADLPALFAIGAGGIAVQSIALNAGAREMSAAAASFVTNTVPVFTAALSWLLLKQPPSRRLIAGIAVSMAGVALIAVSEGGRASMRGSALFNAGTALVLCAAICQASYFLALKHFAGRYGPVELTTYVFAAAAIVLLPVLPSALTTLRSAPGTATLLVVYLAVFAGIVATVAYNRALASLPVTEAVTALFAVPVATLAMGWVLLGESLRPMGVVGGALALAGVALATVRRETRNTL